MSIGLKMQAADGQGYDKEQSRLTAVLALYGGYQLHELSNGGFIVARHDFSAFAPDLRGVKRLAECLVGGAA